MNSKRIINHVGSEFTFPMVIRGSLFIPSGHPFSYAEHSLRPTKR